MDVRLITDSELLAWIRALNTGFLRPPTPTPQALADRRTALHGSGSRCYGAFDRGSCVATYRSFPQELTAVGGRPVPADAISNVAVSPTHRRRGLLTRMITEDLSAAKDRGDVVATLIAAEYRIYGRYGFGPATTSTQWTVDVARCGLDRSLPVPGEGGGRIDLVDAAEVRKLGPELHERVRLAQPGAVSRHERWWDLNTGALNQQGGEWTEPYYAVHRSAQGLVEGMVAYTADDNWTPGRQPRNTAAVQWLLSVTPAAERALWHFLCSIDWITEVSSDRRSPDDLLPLFLPDPRAARIVSQADWLWVRLLDVAAAMEARSYDGTGGLVLEVVDRTGPAGGRFALDAGPGGASCVPTSRSADLTLDVAELASLWLGDQSAVRLVALGRIGEEREGAARRADALLRTSGRPWCPDLF